MWGTDRIGGGAVTPYSVDSPRLHGLLYRMSLCRMSSNLLDMGRRRHCHDRRSQTERENVMRKPYLSVEYSDFYEIILIRWL